MSMTPEQIHEKKVQLINIIARVVLNDKEVRALMEDVEEIYLIPEAMKQCATYMEDHLKEGN